MIRFVQRIGVSITGAMLAAILSLALVTAQEASGLTPSFGDGTLTIIGGGFQPNEQVRIEVRVGGMQVEVSTTANAQGEFRLRTDIPVQPGQSVELTAHGSQGTSMAAITSVPPPLSGGVEGPPAPAQAGQAPLGAPIVAVMLASAGILLLLAGKWTRRNRIA